ncbi:hypothetical protein ACFX1X_027510 [Malus domestica]
MCRQTAEARKQRRRKGRVLCNCLTILPSGRATVNGGRGRLAKKGKAPKVASLSPSMAQSYQPLTPTSKKIPVQSTSPYYHCNLTAGNTAGFILKPQVISINGYKSFQLRASLKNELK